jgi:hypothetical protein
MLAVLRVDRLSSRSTSKSVSNGVSVAEMRFGIVELDITRYCVHCQSTFRTPFPVVNYGILSARLWGRTMTRNYWTYAVLHSLVLCYIAYCYYSKCCFTYQLKPVNHRCRNSNFLIVVEDPSVSFRYLKGVLKVPQTFKEGLSTMETLLCFYGACLIRPSRSVLLVRTGQTPFRVLNALEGKPLLRRS